MLHIGLISYLNAFPFTWSLERDARPDWHLVSRRPGELNTALRAGALDLSLISAMEYAKNPDLYLLVPGVCLSSAGYVDSVRLLSKIPFDQLQSQLIHVTSASATSVAAMTILLAEEGIRPGALASYDPAAGFPKQARTVLTIGDEAMNTSAADFAYCRDIGADWTARFDRSLVFAVAALRRDRTDLHARELADLCLALATAPALAFNDPAALEASCRQRYPAVADPLTYLRRLRYSWGPKELDDLRFLFAKAAEHGLIGSAPALEFYNVLAQTRA